MIPRPEGERRHSPRGAGACLRLRPHAAVPTRPRWRQRTLRPRSAKAGLRFRCVGRAAPAGPRLDRRREPTDPPRPDARPSRRRARRPGPDPGPGDRRGAARRPRLQRRRHPLCRRDAPGPGPGEHPASRRARGPLPHLPPNPPTAQSGGARLQPRCRRDATRRSEPWHGRRPRLASVASAAPASPPAPMPGQPGRARLQPPRAVPRPRGPPRPRPRPAPTRSPRREARPAPTPRPWRRRG